MYLIQTNHQVNKAWVGPDCKNQSLAAAAAAQQQWQQRQQQQQCSRTVAAAGHSIVLWGVLSSFIYSFAFHFIILALDSIIYNYFYCYSLVLQ